MKLGERLSLGMIQNCNIEGSETGFIFRVGEKTEEEEGGSG